MSCSSEYTSALLELQMKKITIPVFASCEKFKLYPRSGGHERTASCKRRLQIKKLAKSWAVWEIIVRNETLSLISIRTSQTRSLNMMHRHFHQIFENENLVSPRLVEWWSAVQKRKFHANFLSCKVSKASHCVEVL